MPRKNKTGIERQIPGNHLHMEPTGMEGQWQQSAEEQGLLTGEEGEGKNFS